MSISRSGEGLEYTYILTTSQFPYPCIGMFRFLDLSIPSSPYYNEVIERLRAGEIFLDLGCCFGQELRQLVCIHPTRDSAV